MTWLIPNYSYKSAITHISKMAYSSDEHFFDCFIDRYYMLNFINVEKQFEKIDDELNVAYIQYDYNSLGGADRLNPEKSDKTEPAKMPLKITNNVTFTNTELYILEYSLVSNHGEILKNNALRRNIYFYDHGGNINEGLTKTSDLDSDNFIEQYSEPLIGTPDNNGTLPQTTSVSEFTDTNLDTQTFVGQWVGVDYGNAHTSYKFSHLLNDHNHKNLEKNMLKVKLSGFNNNIIRGSRLKVEIYIDKATSKIVEINRTDADSTEDQSNKLSDFPNNKNTYIVDRFLSDSYYVKTISYSYTNGTFETDLLLTKRNWIPAIKNKIKT
jgi:hypothetical protein